MNETALNGALLRAANAAPQQWGELLTELRIYTRDLMGDVVLADTANVVILQGRARQCLAFIEMFEKAARKPR